MHHAIHTNIAYVTNATENKPKGSLAKKRSGIHFTICQSIFNPFLVFIYTLFNIYTIFVRYCSSEKDADLLFTLFLSFWAVGKAAVAIALILLIGDFLSTFVYHVPEHAVGRLHCRVHHETKQTFQHYAVLSARPLVMLDGLLGALPYILCAIAFYPLSPIGTVIALILGEFHVVWRHTTKMGWHTPKWVQQLCHTLSIVTPEEHWRHHENGAIAFGDIFSFFDQPAQHWLHTLTQIKKQLKKRASQQA